MNDTNAPTAIGPDAYTSWRGTPLGVITETIEHRLILGIMGNLSGARVLNIGCGDGVLSCAAAGRGGQVCECSGNSMRRWHGGHSSQPGLS